MVSREGVELSSLDKPLFDGAEATKGDLVDYVDAMADRLLPVLAGRPLSVIRVRPGQAPFMQKNAPKGMPDWIPTVTVWSQASKREIHYPLCEDRRTLIWFANQRAVELHVPLMTVGTDEPSHLVMDLDPPEGGGFGAVVAAARLVRQALTEAGLQSAVKTSGSKGLHIFVPLTGVSAQDAADATRAVAVRAERLDPSIATTAYIKDERQGKVFLDSTRSYGATVAAAYTPRIRPGVSVSFPLAWDALDGAKPSDFTIKTVPQLLGGGDPWRELMPAAQALPPDLVEEGREIPVARVVAMHEGKRRKREAAREEGTSAG